MNISSAHKTQSNSNPSVVTLLFPSAKLSPIQYARANRQQEPTCVNWNRFSFYGSNKYAFAQFWMWCTVDISTLYRLFARVLSVDFLIIRCHYGLVDNRIFYNYSFCHCIQFGIGISFDLNGSKRYICSFDRFQCEWKRRHTYHFDFVYLFTF